jgi:hypothetical protein
MDFLLLRGYPLSSSGIDGPILLTKKGVWEISQPADMNHHH